MKNTWAFSLRLFATAFAWSAASAQTDTSPATALTKTKMNSYVLIFRQGPRKLTDADLASRQQEVSAWARAQNAAGHKLEPRIVAPDVLYPDTEANRAYAALPAAWPVTALLFVEAADLAAAAEIAASHPAGRYGAAVEVRPWAAPAALNQPPAPATASRGR